MQITDFPRLPLPGEIIELGESREVEVRRDAQSANRQFICRWAEWQDICPNLDEPFPNHPLLRVNRIKAKGVGPGSAPINGFEYIYCIVDCEYNTYQLVDDAPVIEWDTDVQVLFCGKGRRWKSTGQYIDDDIGVPLRYQKQTITMTSWQVPMALYLACVGRVNYAPFYFSGGGHVLFEGFTITTHYDYQRGAFYFRTVLRFGHSIDHSWNQSWRPMEFKMESDGITPQKDSSGIYIPEDGVKGTCGWDDVNPPYYQIADMNPLIGLPPSNVYIGF